MLFLSGILMTCKSANRSFIKNSQEMTIQLSRIPDPKVFFILQNNDTLKFNSQDIANLIRKSPLKSVNNLLDSLNRNSDDMIVHQDLSAVGNNSISGILDTWVARELLIEGKAEVSPANHEIVEKLRYVYTKDALGGMQGTFYGNAGKVIYHCVVTFGE